MRVVQLAVFLLIVIFDFDFELSTTKVILILFYINFRQPISDVQFLILT